MLQNILNISNRYAIGLTKVNERRKAWKEKHKDVKKRLVEIAEHLNTNSAYKPGYFVDVLHAWHEETGGTCAEMPSVVFRSGSVPMQVAFKSSVGEKKEYNEEGFRISFTPTITGQVIVIISPHNSVLYQEPPQPGTLAVIDEPGKITDEVIDQLVTAGMQAAFYTSFTGMWQQEQQEEQQQQPKYNPIGFKHHETTEKVG